MPVDIIMSLSHANYWPIRACVLWPLRTHSFTNARNPARLICVHAQRRGWDKGLASGRFQPYSVRSHDPPHRGPTAAPQATSSAAITGVSP